MKKVTVSEAIKAVETIKAYCKQVDGLACAWNECKFAKYCDAIRNRLPEEWILPNDAKKERRKTLRHENTHKRAGNSHKFET